MIIPKHFFLGGVKWTVKCESHLPELQGHCDSKHATIHVEDNDNRTVMEQAFCHELIHAFFFATGRIEDHDEVLIDSLGTFMHQFMTRKENGN